METIKRFFYKIYDFVGVVTGSVVGAILLIVFSKKMKTVKQRRIERKIKEVEDYEKEVNTIIDDSNDHAASFLDKCKRANDSKGSD